MLGCRANTHGAVERQQQFPKPSALAVGAHFEGIEDVSYVMKHYVPEAGVAMSQRKTSQRRRKKKITPWQRRRRRVLFVLAFFALLLSVWLVWRLQKRAALNDALQQVAALGVPITKAGYETRFGPYTSFWEPRKLSSDSPYQAVLDAYTMPDPKDWRELPSFQKQDEDARLDEVPYGSPMLDAMEAFVASNEGTLRALHEVAQSGAAAPQADRQVKFLVELLATSACLHAHRGDADGAFDGLEDALVLLRGGDRGFGPETHAIASIPASQLLFTAMESVLRRVRFSDGQLATLQMHLSAGDWKAQQLERDIVGQSRYVIESRVLRFADTKTNVLNMLTGFYEVERANQLNAWCVQRELVGLSLKEQDSIIAGYEGKPIYPYLFYRISGIPMFPVVAHASLGVVRYTQDHDALPETLDALVPDYCAEVPVDFWSGGPLRYNVDDRAFSVYSVGRNRNNDGGDDRKKDIIFKTVLP